MGPDPLSGVTVMLHHAAVDLVPWAPSLGPRPGLQAGARGLVPGPGTGARRAAPTRSHKKAPAPNPDAKILSLFLFNIFMYFFKKV